MCIFSAVAGIYDFTTGKPDYDRAVVNFRHAESGAQLPTAVGRRIKPVYRKVFCERSYGKLLEAGINDDLHQSGGPTVISEAEAKAAGKLLMPQCRSGFWREVKTEDGRGRIESRLFRHTTSADAFHGCEISAATASCCLQYPGTAPISYPPPPFIHMIHLATTTELKAHQQCGTDMLAMIATAKHTVSHSAL